MIPWYKTHALAFPLSLLAAVSTAAALPKAAASATLAADIEELTVPQAEAELFSGVILIASGDRVLFHRPYGFANWELRVPASPSTRFGIASVTKPLTETLAHVLADAGRLDLDAPVQQYLPGFPKGPNGGAPTVRHLLTHESGVPHRVTTPSDEAGVLLAADIVERVRETGLLFEPGTDRLYSSAGFTCLARVIEVIEEKPFEAVLAERVLGPAGMASATSETGQRLMPGRAMPYRLGAYDREVVVKHAPYADLRFLTGAGSVYATAEDLLHFVQAVQSGVFGEDLADEAFAGDPEAWQGWVGWTNGYEAYVDVLPSEDLVFVLLSNLRSAANWQLREQIQNVLAGRPAARIALPPPVAVPFEEPEALTGSYGPAEIRLVEGRLFRGDNELYPVEGRKYYIPASGSTMRFRRDAAGAVDAIVSIRGDGRESVLPRAGGG